MLAFPSILLAIAVVCSVLGPSLQNALIAIAIINIPNFGRLIRSRVLSSKARGIYNGSESNRNEVIFVFSLVIFYRTRMAPSNCAGNIRDCDCHY